MERNYDELISDVLIQLVYMEQSLALHEQRARSFNKRMDLTIKRVVKLEQRLEQVEKNARNTEKVYKSFMANQDDLNHQFLNFITKNPAK